MKNLFNKLAHSRSAKAATALSVFAGALVASGIAGATTYDPTTALTGLGSQTTSTAAPIMIAVVGSLIALGVVFWVVRRILRIFGIKF
jgi:hypothetical protein